MPFLATQLTCNNRQGANAKKYKQTSVRIATNEIWGREKMTNGDKVREKLKDNIMLAALYVYQPETYRGGIRYWRATHVGKFEDYGDAFNAEMKWLESEAKE